MKLPAPSALRALRRRDSRLAAAMRRVEPYPGFPVPAIRRMTSFEYLARAIVYQQLAGKAAATIHRRVCALTPGTRFPGPEEFLELSPARTRRAGLSGNKHRAIQDLAERVSDGRLVLRSLGRLADEAVVERLVAVRGIGLWSAQMFLMFRLGRLDVMPGTDLGVREGLRRLDGLSQRPTPTEVQERALAWEPLRTVAAWTLWRLADTSL